MESGVYHEFPSLEFHPDSVAFDAAPRGSVLIGAPDRVADQIRARQKDLGLDGIMLETNRGGLVAHGRDKEALRPPCQEAMQRFR